MPSRDLAALISREYLAQQQLMHRSGKYGRSGDRWLATILELMASTGAQDVLDYGCGKGSLGVALEHCSIRCQDYDPAFGSLALPGSADLVVCTDVLEHIEPKCLDAVLDHLCNLTRVALFVAISTRPSGKHMKDGRNAHLIVRPDAWWRQKLETRFRVKRVWETPEEEWVAMLRTVGARS